jgi:formylglycine-generating enzyme required for sulfatase activity
MRGGLEIGRFEVTQAQFMKFRLSSRDQASQSNQEKSAYTLIELSPDAPGGMTDFNGPAHKISLDDANAYVTWLSKFTGETWRLPYEDEVKDLYENRDGENTLDYWAGYAPNPEDAARLREKAKELSGTAPLLKEVGSFHGQGKDDEEPMYDLGGNVAEWVLTRDGKGKVVGGSADCPADLKTNCVPAPEYIGFRVVRGAAKPAPPSH